MKKESKISKKIKTYFKKRKDRKNRKLKSTLIITAILCSIMVLIVAYIQIYSQSKIVERCSYLDPITIDLLAFFAAVFLFIEGIVRIIEHPLASLKRQSTRIIRVCFGAAIMTLHIIQFIHK